MNNNQFNRVMKLIRRTGDRCIVLDSASDEAAVVMNLDEYEGLLDKYTPVDKLDESEMLDRINRDISHWRATHDVEETEEEECDCGCCEKPVTLEPENFEPLSEKQEVEEEPDELDEHVTFDEEEESDGEEFFVEKQKEEKPEEIILEPLMEQAVKDVTEPVEFANVGSEEKITDLPEEEDKFYLEPVDE